METVNRSLLDKARRLTRIDVLVRRYKVNSEQIYEVKCVQFRRWMALFFIQRGNYKITTKGFMELAPKEVRMDTHFGEHDAARRRDRKQEIFRPLSEKEKRAAVREKVSQMISDGEAEELYGQGYIDYKASWTDERTRVLVIKKLVETLRMDQRKFTKKQFRDNGLSGMLSSYYADSPYRAFIGAGFAYSVEQSLEHARTGNFQTNKIYPWEMSVAPNGFHKLKINRVAAVTWLVWKLTKQRNWNVKDICEDDFERNSLGGLLVSENYKGSSYLALVESGFAYSFKESLEHARTGNFQTNKIYPWEMKSVPYSFGYRKKEHRVAAVTWLVWKKRELKEPYEMLYDDFVELGLEGLLATREEYGWSHKAALIEAGFLTQERVTQL